MPISENLHTVNLTPVILKTFWSIYWRWEWTGNLISGGSESFVGTYVMSFQVGIGSRGGTGFFQVGLCTPLQTMNFIKKGTLAQLFSWEFCKISKNTFFAEHLWATASVLSLFFLVMPFHCVVLNFEKKNWSFVKYFPLEVFTVVSFFTKGLVV